MNENRPRRRAAAAQAAQAPRKTSKKAHARRAKMNRMLMTIALLMIVAVISISGTIAWLQADTTVVSNTFTTSNIGVTLAETTGTTYDLVPGVDLSKDPKVTVTGDVDCYVFVTVKPTAWPDSIVTAAGTRKVDYQIASGWTALDTTKYPNVYYRTETAANASATDGASYNVLAGNNTFPNGVITVSGELTKEDMAQITANMKLEFQAFAIQQANGTGDSTFTPEQAWLQVKPADPAPETP